MSNHFAKPSIHIQNVSSCVSNHAQHAAGLGRAVRTYEADSVVYCSFGESSSSASFASGGSALPLWPQPILLEKSFFASAAPRERREDGSQRGWFASVG